MTATLPSHLLSTNKGFKSNSCNWISILIHHKDYRICLSTSKIFQIPYRRPRIKPMVLLATSSIKEIQLSTHPEIKIWLKDQESIKWIVLNWKNNWLMIIVIIVVAKTISIGPWSGVVLPVKSHWLTEVEPAMVRLSFKVNIKLRRDRSWPLLGLNKMRFRSSGRKKTSYPRSWQDNSSRMA